MNDETEPFERRLSRQPLREIPGEWRAEILAAAHAAQPSCHSSLVTRHSFLSTLNQQLSNYLWPHPKAWAGLAAVWILILAVNFSVREAPPGLAAKSAPSSPETMVELKKQQRLFAELVGENKAPDADRQRIFSPRPRSERAEILMT